MPSPIPKPSGRRVRKDREGLGLIVGGTHAPSPPAGLLKATRTWWAEYWRSPVAGAARADTDLPALERLAGLYDDRERARRKIRRDGQLVMGSKGQPVLHPLLRQIGAFDAEIRQLEDRFGLTPMSRLRLGVQLEDARRRLEDLNREIDDDDDRPAADPRAALVVAGDDG